MNVSPNELRKETVRTLKEVNSGIESIKQDLGLTGIQSTTFMCSLLLAKAQCLNTLVLLNEKRN